MEVKHFSKKSEKSENYLYGSWALSSLRSVQRVSNCGIYKITDSNWNDMNHSDALQANSKESW